MWSRKVLTLILVRELGTLAGNFSSLTKLCFPYVNHTKNGFQILLHQLLENGNCVNDIAIIVYKLLENMICIMGPNSNGLSF